MDAGDLLQRLHQRGPKPYSLCEALGEANCAALRRWAQTVPPSRLSDNLGHAGLVFLTLVAEHNRRESPGDVVWPGIADLFGNVETRSHLFTTTGAAKPETYKLIRDAAERFHLRHVFDESHGDSPRWYLTIQLQFGWSRPQLERHLPDWLGGQVPSQRAL